MQKEGKQLKLVSKIAVLEKRVCKKHPAEAGCFLLSVDCRAEEDYCQGVGL